MAQSPWQLELKSGASLKAASDELLVARRLLDELARDVATHIVAPPNQTGEQWVLGVLELADRACDFASEADPSSPARVIGEETFEAVYHRHDCEQIQSGLNAASRYAFLAAVLATPRGLSPEGNRDLDGAGGKSDGTSNQDDQEAGNSAQSEMTPAVKKAYLAYKYAEIMNAKKQLEDQEAYDWLRENGFDHNQDLGALTDYTLPDSFETYKRYLVKARNILGEPKYTPRKGRKHGGSIVRKDQIE